MRVHVSLSDLSRLRHLLRFAWKASSHGYIWGTTHVFSWPVTQVSFYRQWYFQGTFVVIVLGVCHACRYGFSSRRIRSL